MKIGYKESESCRDRRSLQVLFGYDNCQNIDTISIHQSPDVLAEVCGIFDALSVEKLVTGKNNFASNWLCDSTKVL